ncbi:antibiotic biosynthesis monooxygenase [Candidatus Poseidoniaceae archaeon]|nr:antibiotic biosynthesis monooxygenase [Candidatus Poseidoniaceae archaeon]
MNRFWALSEGVSEYPLQSYVEIKGTAVALFSPYPLSHNALLKPIETLTKDYIPEVGGGNMYYRVSIAQINPEQKDAFVARADELRDAMQALPGLQSVTFIQTGEGEAVGLAVYDSEESFMKAAPLVVEIMGGFAEFFTAPPEQSSGPIIWSM